MSRKDEAYAYIKNAILRDIFSPGVPLRETEISETLHMSRTPVREALKELEAEGVVTIYASHATIVTSLTASDVEEIFELRSLLEVWSLEKGIHRFVPAELDMIEKKMRAADKSCKWEAIHEADLCLHSMIVARSGSKRLAVFMKNLNTQIERISTASAADPKRKVETFQEHMQIIQCLRSGDLEQTKAALRTHLEKVAAAAMEQARML